MAAVLFRGLLRCTYTDHIEDAANQIKVVSALKGKHKCIEYRARLTGNQTHETLETEVTLIQHTTGMARLDYGPQRITEFTYGSVRRGFLITDVSRVKHITATAYSTTTQKSPVPTYGRPDLSFQQPLNKSTLTLRLLILNI